jgi:hypothetical protein
MSNHDDALKALGISDTDHAHIIDLLNAGTEQLSGNAVHTA